MVAAERVELIEYVLPLIQESFINQENYTWPCAKVKWTRLVLALRLY